MSNLSFEFVHFPHPNGSEEPLDNDDGPSSLPAKRKRGRPVGSKTIKRQHVEGNDEQSDGNKRRPGRPRGSGPKQRAQAQENSLARITRKKWKPGDPILPGNDQKRSTSLPAQPIHPFFAPCSVPQLHTINPTLQPPPHANGRTVINNVQDQVDAEAIPSNFEHPPAHLPQDDIQIIDDVEDATNLVSLASEGLGDDEGEGDDDDDVENDDGGDEDSGRAGDGRTKNKRRPLPPWLQNIFQDIVDELNEDRKGLQGHSRHYAAGTFWLPRKSVWFHLHKQNIQPTDTFVPDFFLWDPADLLPGLAISCPNCSHPLTRHTIAKRPRRVVDIDSCFWMIGAIYRCRKGGVGGCGKMFRSWDSRILAKLPRALAAEFPAHLTWRSGLSRRAFGIVRSCIQHGMAAGAVAEMFRMQHLRRYDEICLQYLHTMIGRTSLSRQHYEPFHSFDDKSENGFHGFTPSGQWFRDVYDNVMEGHRDVLNQHTAMLTGRVCAIDHSHKLAKHVFKVNGVPIFTALLTVTNEKGEIRVCLFVATKSHSQYVEALRKMSHDLTQYGHPQPELFYTDNLIDKGMLESIFTSLLNEVTPIEKYAHLPYIALPLSCTPQVLSSVTEINNTIRGILDDIPSPSESLSDTRLVVGFDSEWNVETSMSGHIVGHGPPAVIQIAYKKQVFILQVGEMLARKKLPQELLNFLKDDRVIKAGRLVNGDLRQLAIAAGEDSAAFQGGLDLATYAKQRLLISDARTSLEELTAVILGQCLPKNRTERISSNWSDRDLTDEQRQYAARDAYACLCLYERISESPKPASLPATPKLTDCIGLPVTILSRDLNQVVARGIISQAANELSLNGINITPTRTVVSVREVTIPATIMAQHQKRTLSSLGPVPFDVVVLRSHIRIVSPNVADVASSTPIPASQPSNNVDSYASEPQVASCSGLDSDPETPFDGLPISDLFDGQTEDASTEATHLSESDMHERRDSQSADLGAETLGSRTPNLNSFIRSRVLKDVFHVFHMLYISRTHGLRVHFARALRDALLIPHPEDKARIEVWLKTKGLRWEDMIRTNATWLWRRCRRTVPPAERLYPLVHDVFMTWGPLKDAKTHLPLFNDAAWKIAKNILELIRYGYVSDPPGISLYYIIGLDTNGLPLYRCIRGTNSVEGGVHTHLRSMLPTCGVSVRHMVTCLLDFILRHNLLVGTFNTTGKKYAGHDSIWLLNEIQELEITLSAAHPDKMPLQLSWVNGNLYQQTTEVMGIAPIPEQVRTNAEMQEYVAETDGTQKQAYLAKMQGTRRPILPVNTIAERKLFNKLMRDSPEFRSSTTSIKPLAVKIWNRHAHDAEGKDIYYKLEEHLTAHFNGNWKEVANSVQSMCQALQQVQPLQRRLRDSERSKDMIHVPAAKMSIHHVDKGFLLPDANHDLP
ncbi:hypothetical protein H0H93_003051 [Arthromyces matolae]|nr:hypothetical protein H0H93_003051 [Arthromyces matolae]